MRKLQTEFEVVFHPTLEFAFNEAFNRVRKSGIYFQVYFIQTSRRHFYAILEC